MLIGARRQFSAVHYFDNGIVWGLTREGCRFWILSAARQATFNLHGYHLVGVIGQPFLRDYEGG